MSVLRSTLGWGRRVADGRMTETVQIGIFVDGFDPETGESTRVLETERYSGPARVKYPSYAVAEQQSPSQPLDSQDVVVSIPVGLGPVFEGDLVLVTGSTVDTALVGREFSVKGQPVAGQVTAYRITVVEQT